MAQVQMRYDDQDGSCMILEWNRNNGKIKCYHSDTYRTYHTAVWSEKSEGWILLELSIFNYLPREQMLIQAFVAMCRDTAKEYKGMRFDKLYEEIFLNQKIIK